jgi:hypothetical protein
MLTRRAVGLLLIAFVILGVPSERPDILGLAGASLTVALKDFIVGRILLRLPQQLSLHFIWKP